MLNKEIFESGLTQFEIERRARFLREQSGCGLLQCIEAVCYAGKHNNLHYEMAYLRAISLAVATPKLTFEERVKSFVRED